MKIDRKKALELGDVRGENILDIGAGDLAIIAADDFDCTVTSIDVNGSILKDEGKRIKRKGLSDRIELKKEDAVDLSYESSEFDTVVSYGALHHNEKEKRKRFIHEAVRVAEKKVLFAEFKPEHHIHPEDVHPAVNHETLRKELSKYGDVKKYEGEEMMLYVLKKGAR